MKPLCSQCGSSISVDDVNLNTMAAKCRHCNEIVYLQSENRPAPAPLQEDRPKISLPRGFQVDESEERLDICYSWFRPACIFMAIFCVVWDGFLVVWYTIGFGMLGMGAGGIAWLFLLFPILHVLIGVAITYGTLASFLNRTVVTVSSEGLVIRHGPIPMGGNMRQDALDIAQFYCEESSRREKQGLVFSYTLNAVTKDGTKRPLIKNLDNKDHALFLEQKLEKFLVIKDRPVPGETAR